MIRVNISIVFAERESTPLTNNPCVVALPIHRGHLRNCTCTYCAFVILAEDPRDNPSSETKANSPRPAQATVSTTNGKTPCPGSPPSPRTWCAWRLRGWPKRGRRRGHPPRHDEWMVSECQRHRYPPDQTYNLCLHDI
jgi:hypothetical protein